jgi:hypothetical protein
MDTLKKIRIGDTLYKIDSGANVTVKNNNNLVISNNAEDIPDRQVHIIDVTGYTKIPNQYRDTNVIKNSLIKDNEFIYHFSYYDGSFIFRTFDETVLKTIGFDDNK